MQKCLQHMVDMEHKACHSICDMASHDKRINCVTENETCLIKAYLISIESNTWVDRNRD